MNPARDKSVTFLARREYNIGITISSLVIIKIRKFNNFLFLTV
ncbi:MAG: hypothetical protein UY07_C0053G0006 [Parcubacteria group bacterium GW2011_GWA1_47_8]|uniref:Uncharacterized protein n=1 Tax=Candidatus Giovannonibacteria bacterium GW2011_GWA2_45_21 TaxID=1618649 RepID=A0A0G1M750_9BACT|nr:MAG: hypothetical protein UX06_C0031G0006 [Candidatus Giovannonibacteria bacterium GW2011_GWA2_45_21]KKU80054.1 MAG: hypothetical protein UY07_C0053G0006 [Parcubacteria group bacterium GW2011_GWA1_47_8]